MALLYNSHQQLWVNRRKAQENMLTAVRPIGHARIDIWNGFSSRPLTSTQMMRERSTQNSYDWERRRRWAIKSISFMVSPFQISCKEGPRLTHILGLGKNRVTWNSCYWDWDLLNKSYSNESTNLYLVVVNLFCKWHGLSLIAGWDTIWKSMIDDKNFMLLPALADKMHSGANDP